MTLPFWCDSPASPRSEGRARLALLPGGEPRDDSSSRGSAAIRRHSGNEPRDQELLSALRKGDSVALDTLMQHYAADLARFAASLTSATDLAQDVVQDVFIKLWDDRATIVIRGSVAGYLLRMTRNRALNVVRHERSQARLAGESVQASERSVRNDAESAVEAGELSELIRAAIAKLPARSREVFLMRRQKGLSTVHVADALGITPAAVQVHVSRALRRIAEYLADNLD